ncbi:hypothetical protein BDR07DRAFT_1391330 [Suillus spraguei]|nr:hypothetical protein BDR07DRAFT_1391330 [Suillus spraguei]
MKQQHVFDEMEYRGDDLPVCRVPTDMVGFICYYQNNTNGFNLGIFMATCAHKMNTISTATALPCTPTDDSMASLESHVQSQWTWPTGNCEYSDMDRVSHSQQANANRPTRTLIPHFHCKCFGTCAQESDLSWARIHLQVWLHVLS